MVAACPFPANHGTPGAIRELSIYLAAQGHDVHVVTYPQYDEGIDVSGLTIHRVASGLNFKVPVGPSFGRLVYDFFLIPKLIQVVLKHDIQIIHTHNYEAAIAGTIAKWLTGRIQVYCGINSMADELPTYAFFKSKKMALRLGRFLDRIVPKAADFLMLLSDELKTYLHKDIGIDEDKLLVIPPGVDLSMFANGNGVLVRQQHKLTAKTPLIMYTGTLEAFQNLGYLFAAMVHVAKKIPDAKLMIVTNFSHASAREEYTKLAEKLGISRHVIFTENMTLKSLPDFLAAADVTVVPRVFCPGYPIKLLNYMAAGTATVSFEGSAKALCHGYNGYVAKNCDAEDMAKGICLLLENPKLREVVGTRAKATIPDVFDWDTLARGTAKVYEILLEPSLHKVDKKKLNGYLKSSYIPHFGSDDDKDSDAFLRSDFIEFPEF